MDTPPLHHPVHPADAAGSYSELPAVAELGDDQVLTATVAIPQAQQTYRNWIKHLHGCPQCAVRIRGCVEAIHLKLLWRAAR